MTGSRAGVLYLPNESGDLEQRGPRRALGSMRNTGGTPVRLARLQRIIIGLLGPPGPAYLGDAENTQ